MCPPRFGSGIRRPKCRSSPRLQEKKHEQPLLSPCPATPANGVSKKATAKARLNEMSAARVRREKQLAAAVADEQAARAELERAAREEELRPARQALANAISRRDDKRLELEDAQDKADAAEKAWDDARDREWSVERDFANAQGEVNEARKTLNALESGDDSIKKESEELWDAGV